MRRFWIVNDRWATICRTLIHNDIHHYFRISINHLIGQYTIRWNTTTAISAKDIRSLTLRGNFTWVGCSVAISRIRGGFSALQWTSIDLSIFDAYKSFPIFQSVYSDNRVMVKLCEFLLSVHPYEIKQNFLRVILVLFIVYWINSSRLKVFMIVWL